MKAIQVSSHKAVNDISSFKKRQYWKCESGAVFDVRSYRLLEVASTHDMVNITFMCQPMLSLATISTDNHSTDLFVTYYSLRQKLRSHNFTAYSRTLMKRLDGVSKV